MQNMTIRVTVSTLATSCFDNRYAKVHLAEIDQLPQSIRELVNCLSYDLRTLQPFKCKSTCWWQLTMWSECLVFDPTTKKSKRNCTKNPEACIPTGAYPIVFWCKSANPNILSQPFQKRFTQKKAELQIQRSWIPHDVCDREIHMHQSSAISRIQEGMHLRVGFSDTSWKTSSWNQQSDWRPWSFLLFEDFGSTSNVDLSNLNPLLHLRVEETSRTIWLSRIQTPVTEPIWQETSMFIETWNMNFGWVSILSFLKWNRLQRIRNFHKAPHVEVHVRVVDCSGHLPSRNLPRSHRHSNNFPPALRHRGEFFGGSAKTYKTWLMGDRVAYVAFSKKDHFLRLKPEGVPWWPSFKAKQYRCLKSPSDIGFLILASTLHEGYLYLNLKHLSAK